MTSSITGLIAETVKHAGTKKVVKPRFGSFVRVDSPENDISIFAIVFNVITNPPDSVHKPSALGLTRDQLRVEQPHIFALLKTEVHAQIVGYLDWADKAIYQHLPPQPPEVHDFVYSASKEEVLKLSSEFEFLRLLNGVTSVPADELMAACVREAARARTESDSEQSTAYLIEAGRAISQLFRSDYERMLSIVRKIKPGNVG
ncbi:HAS-barrel domain-containing protein [soil metagenome]